MNNNMISSDVNDIQSTKKRLKMIQNLKIFKTSKSYYLREFHFFKKPTPLNLMRLVRDINLTQPFFSSMDCLIPAQF